MVMKKMQIHHNIYIFLLLLIKINFSKSLRKKNETGFLY